jgi:hypothetical protein
MSPLSGAIQIVAILWTVPLASGRPNRGQRSAEKQVSGHSVP